MSGARRFRVTAPMGVNIPEGVVLALTDEQAEPRARYLYKVEENYLVEGPVMFKAGEVIGIVESHLSKMFLGDVDEVKDGPDEVVISAAVEEAPTIPVRRGRRAK